MDSSSCLPIKDLFRSCAYIVLISLEEYRENRRSADQSEVKAPGDAVREIRLGVPAALSQNPGKKDSVARHDWSAALETCRREILQGTYRGASMATKRVPDTQTRSMKLNEKEGSRKGEKGR
ncbi:hypothetical protein ALC60_04166 [Trachymyrmex zeteki]|uniref:Uncharacterized protein n=1 Tax=Mycetomoellerius zeteki TaxID=64791 RepID=A0A151X9B9_9HYME|nr:hypothetical protein ALC60_04166 [Trachymyrmex zeteki]